MAITISMMTVSAFPVAAGSLQEQLDAKRDAFTAAGDPEVIAGYQAGIDAVAASGILEKAIQPGGRAPDFTLPNADGTPISLEELLAKGPVVLTWYRGGWCPYCNIALSALRDALPALREAGATLVAISPESPDLTAETVRKLDPGFEVLSDHGQSVANAYGILFRMTPFVAEAMAKHDLAGRNGDEGKQLPLAATYVIQPDGTVAWAFLDADYRRRAEPSEIVAAVRGLSTP